MKTRTLRIFTQRRLLVPLRRVDPSAHGHAVRHPPIGGTQVAYF
jgi:hypothetical protein